MNNYIVKMNQSISKLIKSSLRLSHKKLSLAFFIMKAIRYQKTAVKRRNAWELNGVHVPPFIIASITSACNLRCKGCYAHVHNKKCSQELTTDRWDKLFHEAKELGVTFILIAGGEPFTRFDVIKAASHYREIIFPVFTNGTMINKDNIQTLLKAPNIVPIISIEGKQSETDARRGEGIFNKAEEVMTLLNKKKIFYGLSFTVTNQNFDLLTNEEFIDTYYQKGSKIFFYVEYVPIEKGTEDQVITQSKRESLDEKLNHLRSKFKALFIAFPGDEKQFGGCLSSGRGFVHISSSGNLEPCPFAPYSDTNLNDKSLKEALNSEFLNKIRTSDEHLSETEHGCALFNKADWVQSLLNK